jgi:hypothetical protein
MAGGVLETTLLSPLYSYGLTAGGGEPFSPGPEDFSVVAQPANTTAIINSANTRYVRIIRPSFGEARYFL